MMRKQGERTLNALRAARDLAECFPVVGSDQDRRTDKVRSRLSALSEEKLKKKSDDAYACNRVLSGGVSWLRTVAPNIHPNVDGEVAFAAPINGLAVGYIQV